MQRDYGQMPPKSTCEAPAPSRQHTGAAALGTELMAPRPLLLRNARSGIRLAVRGSRASATWLVLRDAVTDDLSGISIGSRLEALPRITHVSRGARVQHNPGVILSAMQALMRRAVLVLAAVLPLAGAD